MAAELETEGGIFPQNISVHIQEPGHPSTRMASNVDIVAWVASSSIAALDEALRDGELEVLLEECGGSPEKPATALRLGIEPHQSRPYVVYLQRAPEPVLSVAGNDGVRLPSYKVSGRICVESLIPSDGKPARVFRLCLVMRTGDYELRSNAVDLAIPPRELWDVAYGGFLFPQGQPLASDILLLKGWALKKEDQLERVELFLNDTSLGLAEHGQSSPEMQISLPDLEESGACVFTKLLDRARCEIYGVAPGAVRRPLRFRARCSFTSGDVHEFATPVFDWQADSVAKGVQGELESVTVNNAGMIELRGWAYQDGLSAPELHLETLRKSLKLEQGGAAPRLQWLPREDVQFRHLDEAFRRNYGFLIEIPPLYFGRFPGQIRLLASGSDGSRAVLSSRADSRRIASIVTGHTRGRAVDRVGGLLASGLTVCGVRKRMQACALPQTSDSSARAERILFATHNLSNVEGAPKVLAHVVASLIDDGAEPSNFHVVSAAPGLLGAYFERLGVQVTVIPALRSEGHSWERVGEGFEAFQQVLTAFKPGKIYANVIDTFWAIAAANQLGLPSYWAIHESVTPEKALPQLDPRLRIQYLQTLSRAPYAIFVSESTQQLYTPFLHSAESVVIPNGIDAEQVRTRCITLSREQARKQLELSEDDIVVSIIGTVTHRKGQDIFVQEMALLRQLLVGKKLRCFVVGTRNDSFFDSLQALAVENGVSDILSFVPETPDVLPYYRASDVMVIASRIESAPLVSLEAFAYGVPLVSTSAFGLAEQIEHERNALAFSVDNPGELAQQIERLVSDPELRERLVTNAHGDIAERFALDRMLKRYKQLLKAAKSDKEASLTE